jgi:hypothetical protein
MTRNANFEGPSGTRSDVRPEHERKIQNLIAASLENKSRDEVARRMTAMLHSEITRSKLDAFAAGSKVTAHFRASFVSAFCEACGDDRLRLELMGARLRKLVEFAQKSVAAAHDRRELRRLLDDLLDEEDHA